ncbi:MAG: hypothetical protein ACOC1P_05515 [Minisyncoccales bacterium]
MSGYNEKNSGTKAGYNIEVIGTFYQTPQEMRDCLERLEAKVLPKIQEHQEAKRAAWQRARKKVWD